MSEPLACRNSADAAPPLATADHFVDRLTLTSNLFAPLVWGRPSHEWQPWPVESPAIDRVHIHWPSDDWPPPPPACVPDPVVAAPPQLLFIVDRGNFIDMRG